MKMTPSEIRTYLKENMAEGYLSEEEGMNIDKFVDEYEEMMESQEKIQGLVEEIQRGGVL